MKITFENIENSDEIFEKFQEQIGNNQIFSITSIVFDKKQKKAVVTYKEK